MGLNGLVFLAWQYAIHEFQTHKDPHAYLFMTENFLSSLKNIREGRIWTMITSCISHQETGHILLNMISLSFMAPQVLHLIGPKPFLGLYFGAGLVTSLTSLAWRAFIAPSLDKKLADQHGRKVDTSGRGSHGASGSVFAILTTFACLSPKTTFTLFFVLPLPAWVCVPGLFAWDLYSAWFRPQSVTDSAGHMGGVAAGYAFWRIFLRRARLS